MMMMTTFGATSLCRAEHADAREYYISATPTARSTALGGAPRKRPECSFASIATGRLSTYKLLDYSALYKMASNEVSPFRRFHRDLNKIFLRLKSGVRHFAVIHFCVENVWLLPSPLSTPKIFEEKTMVARLQIAVAPNWPINYGTQASTMLYAMPFHLMVTVKSAAHALASRRVTRMPTINEAASWPRYIFTTAPAHARRDEFAHDGS